VPQIILGLVITKGKQILTDSPSHRGHTPGIGRKQVELVADRLGHRVNDDIHISRAQTSPKPEKAERETR
jgi:hypothetical protein